MYSRLDRLGRRQHGLVSSEQLARLGFTEDQVELLLGTQRMAQVRRGVYRLCGVEPTWRSAAMGAVLAAGEGAVLSHRSAGVLWGFLDGHCESGPLEVIGTGQHRLNGVLAHRHRLGAGETTRRQGIPVTTAERTLFDLAGTVPDITLGHLCDEGLRRRVVTLGRLHAVVKANLGSGRRRLAPIQAVLADRITGYAPAANDWERRMQRLWDRLGLPAAEREYRVRVGRRTYRVDRAIVDLRIAVEWNGFDPHGFRGHLDRDSDRRANLAAAGWYCLGFTSRSSPKLICDTVLAVVAERQKVLGQAS